MNEEAGFIAALLADPDDRTVLLVYADWLDERDDPRAEYLRLLAAEQRNVARLAALRRVLDIGWVMLLASRAFGVGCRMKMRNEAYKEDDAEVVTISAERASATVCLTIWYTLPFTVTFVAWELEVVKRP
jgi:uncharacterized protein (TIGR02996 family)